MRILLEGGPQEVSEEWVCKENWDRIVSENDLRIIVNTLYDEPDMSGIMYEYRELVQVLRKEVPDTNCVQLWTNWGGDLSPMYVCEIMTFNKSEGDKIQKFMGIGKDEIHALLKAMIRVRLRQNKEWFG